VQENLNKLYGKHRQLILYGLIGLIGATIDFILYIILYRSLGVPPVIASFLSVSAGIVNNFIINSRHNFKVNDRLWYRFVNFYAIGIGGAILSSVLILILFNGLEIDATVAKLITIIPVVLLQFVLNKKLSFRKLGDATSKNYSIFRLIKSHSLFLLVVFVFLFSSLMFVKNIPPTGVKGAPDENAHMEFNVEFILGEKRLPVSGVDDLNAYENCRDNKFGKIPCLYSYTAYPGANYVFSSLFAWTLHEVLDLSILTGARLASVFWGLIFLSMIYLTSRRITHNNRISAAITASVGLIPQVIFTSSYVNQDAHSLAIGGIVIYAFTRFLQKPDRTSLIIAGIAFGGLLPLSKYNYFIFIPFVAAILFYALYKKILSKKHLLQLVLFSLVSFLLLAGFWYIRNIILYSDPLGQSFVVERMSDFHKPGISHDITSFETYKLYALDNTFFDRLFHSFFVAFGYMAFYLKEFTYSNIQILLFSAVFVSLYISSNLKKAARYKATLVLLGLTLFLFGSITLAYYNSTTYDFQPQGRYIFPILPAIALAAAYLYRISTNFKYPILILLFTTLYTFILSIEVFIRNYL
jgi:putative flippase GtrA